MQDLKIYNTLSGKKEIFKPINSQHVKMYVCGPTVYGEGHLGHARPAITFDILFRYLKYLGYKVRYVRNITDVGHLLNDADDGGDKIGEKAKSLQLEPMEVAHYYTKKYHDSMQKLNVENPSIEPIASGHIIEQIEMIKKIIDNGFGYEVNGSVYFDVVKYNESNNYGILSRRKIEDMMDNTRELDGQSDKKNQVDFALWKKASPEHIMRWPSPWGDGFPGWHLECSAMSCKYLGEEFDIHGGGMDLVFPHHEAEIAQCCAANNNKGANYWMHNNMITIGGQKMGKSLGNFITLDQFFNGTHSKLNQAYHPMVIRFFLLQAHYRSTIDFSNDALQAAEKGLIRLFNAIKVLNELIPKKQSTIDVSFFVSKCDEAMNDDLNTPIVLSHLFELVKIINSAKEGSYDLKLEDIDNLKQMFHKYTISIFGLHSLNQENNTSDLDGLMNLILDIRNKSKENKDWATADKIREELNNLSIQIKDTKDGSQWSYKN
ncbi:MAG: cysteine--tRNA ligase [Flavobacteriales bacterium]|nr:cysteine--tRNA ligase [Flavobacteriales bacterium]|tara:strand:+ start:9626 stop:11092 length:1467 start_codon:yes stop_codon:yes gene_type:complete